MAGQGLSSRFPALAYAGAWHLVLAVGDKARLDRLDYDFATLEALMHERGLTTLQLVWRESPTVFPARNPFPMGGGGGPGHRRGGGGPGGYLREAGLIQAPARLTVRQRLSRLEVVIPGTGGIEVS
ncbi:PhzF family phenazine biosynthesis protein [Halomonas beimenensis]|uniref:Phenazine biosynthesis protein PhzF like n=1 Tax=Halomonas beimenensis TaxID=475662 RepID=A0A291PB27_9GAMM|nr:PhzF family phenazine biosynthesis protein [Halomonas beimenensis]ATJ84072.1 phenazine biosynthesis protein PhzF like [Halomonas beimenensis]